DLRIGDHRRPALDDDGARLPERLDDDHRDRLQPADPLRRQRGWWRRRRMHRHARTERKRSRRGALRPERRRDSLKGPRLRHVRRLAAEARRAQSRENGWYRASGGREGPRVRSTFVARGARVVAQWTVPGEHEGPPHTRAVDCRPEKPGRTRLLAKPNGQLAQGRGPSPRKADPLAPVSQSSAA